MSGEQVTEQFKMFASRIDTSDIAALPVQNRGRLKPLQTFSREAMLYVMGKYGQFGLDSVQIYLGLVLSPLANDLEIINVRDPDLRVKLGFTKAKRSYSLNELMKSKLEELAKPALAHQEKDSKGLNSEEKALVEAQQQVWLMRGLISGKHLFDGLIFPGTETEKLVQTGAQVNSPVLDKVQTYLKTLASGDHLTGNAMAAELVAMSKSQPMPEMFQKNVDKLGLEVWFNKAKLFFIAALLYTILGIVLVFPFIRKSFEKKPSLVLGLAAVPFLLHNIGFILRVYITGFAPVTNMYGTMIWVAYGVILFGSILFAIYRNYPVYGYLMLGSALTLFLTESLPLILSPDMDPIVAVLRNNFWLTIHVLTITISYAAFTISMLLGNAALVRTIVSKLTGKWTAAADDKFYKEFGQLNYRVIQLGVFFLTAGIILGGIWADYSWGRFWGWDPKETWALIADLGFLAILHARYLGWLKPFGVLAASPVGYLLVIMAWYGVNFILAAGLHSYGFSSGGATMVGTFVFTQLLLIGVAFAAQNLKKTALAK